MSRAGAIRLALTEARQRSGLSQAELARRMGVCRQAVHRYESSRSCPGTDTLWLAAEASGVRPSEIILRAEELIGGPS